MIALSPIIKLNCVLLDRSIEFLHSSKQNFQSELQPLLFQLQVLDEKN